MALAFMPAHVEAQDSGETWTFMVYMSGDSSLSSNVPDDIQEMKKVGSSDTLDIIVLADSSSIGDTNLMKILPGNILDIELATINPAWGDELDLGEPETLSQFVTWAVAAYPADHFMLDLWGHGNGWSGVCPDKGNALEAHELREAMVTISGAGIQLDIISMDACQMGMLEIAYEIRDVADYALLSQKDVPLAGWPYDVFLGYLGGNGTVEEKAVAMIDGYITWGKARSLYSLTLAFLDLSELDGLVQSLDSYSIEAISMVDYFNPEIVRARGITEKYDGDAQYDLVHLLQNINSETNCKSLEAKGREVAQAMDALVIYESHWTNTLDEPADNAHGLSIWFPTYAATIDYMTTSFAKDTGWPGFVNAMAGHFQSPSRTEAVNIVNAVPLDSDDDGLMDSIRISHDAQSAGTTVLEIYRPDGSLFDAETLGASAGTMDIFLESLGNYQAAFYLRDSNGILLNYTLVDSGLVKEGLSTISGCVNSNIGRGLKWVNVNLVDADGRIIKSTVTDSYGHYTLDVIVPTDTNGSGLMLVCGLGSSQTNVTIPFLNVENNIDFTLETSSEYVPWFVRIIGLLNLGGIMLLVYWVAWGREKKPEKANQEMQYLKTNEPISPQ
ncbi:MAG: clostripain-related cysteine peptidase [Thermoplasmata archaeon]|nr:clostripain-related cysteine peptidase [Thermoplasmata archaeon]